MTNPGHDENDPFAGFAAAEGGLESDRTVIKPVGARGAVARAAALPASVQPHINETPLALEALMGTSLNPLVSAASPLLSAAPRIRAMSQHANPASLRDALSNGLRQFERQARADGLPHEQVVAGRYILCTLLDESAASTPWGGSGVWARHSLLVEFHNESWGGEKLFQLLSKLTENVPGNRPLLELLHVVLAFGFEGRYRVLSDGRVQLESVREQLSQMLKQQRAPIEPALSPRWEGVPAKAARLRDGWPLWVVAAIMAVLLMGIYAGLRLAINQRSDPVFAALQALDVKTVPNLLSTAPVTAAAAPVVPRLAQLLKADIQAGFVQVLDEADRSTVVIKGDGLFEPGSSVIAQPVKPLLARIEAALAQLKGAVLVTGHTDNQPIRSLRFPSNWHLSQERAVAVKGLLTQSGGLKPDRVRAEGRAESTPVQDNSTAEGRARNRRVEVTLFVQGVAA
jgi:type VI secretion system protein ImpK